MVDFFNLKMIHRPILFRNGLFSITCAGMLSSLFYPIFDIPSLKLLDDARIRFIHTKKWHFSEAVWMRLNVLVRSIANALQLLQCYRLLAISR